MVDETPFSMILDIVHHNPGEPPFRSAFLDPEFLKDMGYTGQVLNVHVQAAVPLDGVPGEVSQVQSPDRRWMEDYAREIDSPLKAAKQAGLDCFAWTDFVVLPRELMARFGDRIRLAAAPEHPDGEIKGEFTPDIHDPFVQDLLRRQVAGIFDRFPSLDGLVVRVGETYLHDLPYHTGGDPISRGVESHALLLNLLRDEVCEQHGKTLIYRTWLSGIDEDREAYLDLCERVEPHPGLILSIKHCIGDFHRAHPFSPPLGSGRHRQIVEVQCQREYEGKGAYPNWIVEGVVDGFEEYADIMPQGEPRGLRDLLDAGTLAGIWTWSRGGGWLGPHIKDEFWPTLNARAMVAWAHDPELTGEQLLSRAAHGFEEEDLELLKRISRLSASAILKGTASQRGGIDTLWTRDHFIGGTEDPDTPMERAVRRVVKDGRVDEILAERREAVGLWRQIEEAARQIRSVPAERREQVLSSARYGRILYEIYEAGWTLLLLDALNGAATSSRPNDMAAAIRRYDEAWVEFRELAASSPSCASLYEPNYCRYVSNRGMAPRTGMGDSVDRIRRTLTILNAEKKTDT